jgi:hypothetical protein
MATSIKNILSCLFLLSHLIAASQKQIDVSVLPKTPYSPSIQINGKPQTKTLSLEALRQYGLQIVLADKTFKVLQFDIVYDCHSRAFFDFTVKRYYGDRIDSTDTHLQTLIWVGDVIDITNVVIEKEKYRYVMKDIAYIITN